MPDKEVIDVCVAGRFAAHHLSIATCRVNPDNQSSSLQTVAATELVELVSLLT